MINIVCTSFTWQVLGERGASKALTERFKGELTNGEATGAWKVTRFRYIIKSGKELKSNSH